MRARVRNLVPMVHVADVSRSIEFYMKLGFEVGNTFVPPGTEAPVWAWLERNQAQIMLTCADEAVVPEQQAVLFYLYFDDVAETKARLEAAGIAGGAMEYPFYAPKGQFRVTDPDGYVLMLMHT